MVDSEKMTIFLFVWLYMTGLRGNVLYVKVSKTNLLRIALVELSLETHTLYVHRTFVKL
jgi:ribosomal protein L10